MTVFEGSAKDYAASLGLAKAGKGRMSAAALEAVAKARENGMTFSKENVAPSAPRASAAPVAEKVDVSKVDPKAARDWAKKNGIEGIGDRGRVPYGVLVQFKDAMAEAGTVVEDRKTPIGVSGNVKDVRPEAPRTVSVNAKWKRESDGKVLKDFSDRTACQNSGYSISHCNCKDNRHVVTMGNATSAVVSVIR